MDVSFYANPLVYPTVTTGQVRRPKVLIQNMKRSSRVGNAMTINRTSSSGSRPGEDTGVPLLVASFGERKPQGFWSREDQADVLMPWTTDTKTGSSETTGRNRYPRYLLAKESFLPC